MAYLHVECGKRLVRNKMAYLHVMSLGLDQLLNHLAYSLRVAQWLARWRHLIVDHLRCGPVKKTTEVGHLLSALEKYDQRESSRTKPFFISS